MGKMKLLLDVVSDVRSLADSLQILADAMSENETPITEAEEHQKAKKVKKYEKVEVTEVQVKQITLEEVRSVLAVKSKDGFTEQIKEIINGFGADKLSDVDPSNYGDLLKEAEKLE